MKIDRKNMREWVSPTPCSLRRCTGLGVQPDTGWAFCFARTDSQHAHGAVRESHEQQRFATNRSIITSNVRGEPCSVRSSSRSLRMRRRRPPRSARMTKKPVSVAAQRSRQKRRVRHHRREAEALDGGRDGVAAAAPGDAGTPLAV